MEAPASAAPPSGYEATPLLGDDALVEDTTEAPPQPLNAEEELVLTEEDLVADAPLMEAVRPAPAPAEEGIGDFEREPGVGSERAAAPTVRMDAGESRRITLPIDLGTLPRSGRITLSVEISIRVDSDEPRKKPAAGRKPGGLDESFTRDLEPTP